MYEQFYGLREKPFNMTPDPEFLFFTEKHKEAFAHLVYGIGERRGFIEITGEVGAGKTTLCRALLNEFDADTKIALVLNPFLSDIELLRAINEELYIDASGETKKELLDALNKYLIDQHAAGRNVVLVIDESQNLPIETLEQIRIISNLETVKAKLIQIVLVGQPELRQLLSKPELRQLNQRITVRYHISPLSRQETEDYIYYRLRIAGDEGRIHFTEEAIDLVYKFTSGVPRMINILCDHALLSGFVFEQTEIDKEIIKKARKEIEGQEFASMRTMQSRLTRHSLAFGALAAVLLAVLAYSAGRGLLPGFKKEQPAAQVAQLPLLPTSTPLYVGGWPAPTPTNSAVISKPTQPSIEPAVQANLDEGKEEVAKKPVDAAPVVKEEKSENSIVTVPDATSTTEIVVAQAVQPEEPEEVVPTPAPTPVPAPVGKFDPDGILRCTQAGQTRTAGLLTLARQWVDKPGEFENLFTASQNQDLKQWEESAFTSYGLAPVSWSANLNMVRAIDLPAVLEVYEKALFTPVYITLLGFDGERIVVGDPRNGVRVLTETQLGEMWFGRLTILVPLSVKPKMILGRKMQGSEVRMLQIRLKKLGYFATEPTGIYGEYTEEQVRRFQRENRIKIDGLVGLETNLLLFSRLAGADAPRLVEPAGAAAVAGS